MLKIAFFKDKALIGGPTCPSLPVETYLDWDGDEVGVCDIDESEAESLVAAGGRLMTLREIFSTCPDDIYERAQHASQVLYWRRMYRFCPKCGTPLIRKTSGERAMRCEKCSLDFFARINPAVIVAISFQGKLLLAEREGSNGRFFSLIAGFVEPGETIEDAVRREVREEVGLELESLSYIRSQPWPFPSNLMLGFEAVAASGDIKPDGIEIHNAGWFAPDALPEQLPQKISIARKLIDNWRCHAV